ARGRERTLQTGPDGEYRFTLLPPTRYRLTIEQRGFERLVLDDVAALVGTAARVDVTLKVAGVAVQVDVAATAPPLDPNRVQLASVVVAQQLEQRSEERRVGKEC